MTDLPPGNFQVDLSLVSEVALPDELVDLAQVDFADLSALVLREEAASGPWELAVALVDDARLQGLHRDFMGEDTPTDIMTFPLDDAAETRGGDLVISVDHALSQASSWGHTPGEEIQFLVVHGLLHLLGWRDDTATLREAMLERQRALFDRWRRRSDQAE